MLAFIHGAHRSSCFGVNFLPSGFYTSNVERESPAPTNSQNSIFASWSSDSTIKYVSTFSGLFLITLSPLINISFLNLYNIHRFWDLMHLNSVSQDDASLHTVSFPDYPVFCAAIDSNVEFAADNSTNCSVVVGGGSSKQTFMGTFAHGCKINSNSLNYPAV